MGVPANANPLLLASQDTGYRVSRSLRFNSADSAYLSRTPASAGNRTTWTWAGWVKRSKLGTQQSLFVAGETYAGGSGDTWATGVNFGTDDKLNIYWRSSNSPLATTAGVFRDVAAWYHIVLQANATTLKLFVNGTELLSGSISGNGAVNSTQAQLIGVAGYNTYFAYANFMLADVYFIDGQALAPSSFGETDATTGVWNPKAYTGSYGTNGFHLEFADNSSNTATTLGKDTSGNGNNWTPNNLSVTAGAGNDSLVDVPTNGSQTDTGAGGEVRGNYCTLNPLNKGANVTLTNGNIDFSVTASNGSVPSTIGMSSGKWYYEMTMTASSGNTPGLVKSGYNTASYVGNDSLSWGYNAANGQKYTGGSGSSYGATFTNGDVIGIAFDADAGTLVFYKNGSSQGTAYTGLTSGPYFFAVGGGSSSGSVNFGQRAFAYTAPSGFKALCTANLPAPSVTKPSTVMDVLLYTGNGSARSITGLGFNPDLVWIKSRSAATDHELTDSVRGTTKSLSSNLTAVEATDTGGLTAFNSDGFSLGTDTKYNNNAATYAGWCWDAGSSTVTNTAGSITSSVRANATAGFSIVTYTAGATNATVGHGLGVAPELILCKSRSNTITWVVYHKSLGKDAYLFLNGTDAAGTGNTNYWGTAGPNSTTFGLASSTFANNSGNMVAYCFAPVSGLSSFGSYTGNGSADGPFVYLGFRPAFVIVKMSSSTGNWTMLDTKREGYNVDNDPLYPNLSNVEGTTDLIDITSNGFKVRTTDATFNTNAGTYVYAAWAESPFQYSRAR